MKRAYLFILCFLLVISCACTTQKNGNVLLISEEGVSAAHVSSLPEGYDFSFSNNDAEWIREYIADLHLQASFREQPEMYGGMTWVIRLTYNDGGTQTIYHFGNMFFRNENSRWYKMDYQEAAAFDDVIGFVFESSGQT